MDQKHFLQSEYWKRSKEQLGQSIQSIDGINLFLKPSPFGTIGYLPRVPIEAIQNLNLETIGMVYCRIDPLDLKAKNEKLKAKIGVPIQLPKTVIIDLTKSEEELQDQMKQKHRYNLRLAEKKGVEVTIGSSDEELDTFMKLYLDTVSRQNYFGRSEHYLRTVWEEARKDDSCFIATAWYNEIPIASWMLLTYSETVYYPYGGTSDEHRNVMGTYKMVWEIIKWAKERNLKYFDLYGVEEDEADGFSRFKVGFVEKDRSQVVVYAPTIDIVFKSLPYTILRFGEDVRNRFSFLKRFI